MTPSERARTGRRPHVTTWPVGLGIVATIAGAVSFAVCFVDRTRATPGSAARSPSRCSAWVSRSRSGAATWPTTRSSPAGTRCRPTTPRVGPRWPRSSTSTRPSSRGRSFLSKSLVLGIGVFALSQVVLLGALGPWPGDSLRTTGWRKGRRLVDSEGEPVTRDVARERRLPRRLPRGQRPEGRLPDRPAALRERRVHARSPDARRGAPRTSSPTRASARTPAAPWRSTPTWTSCCCARATSRRSTSSTAPRPPAARPSRPLPQLPLAIDDEGVLYAQSDFTEPVGPGFWNA